MRNRMGRVCGALLTAQILILYICIVFDSNTLTEKVSI